MHFHGTADSTVKYGGRNDGALAPLKSVDETIETWRKIDGCPIPPTVADLPDIQPGDGATVRCTRFPPGKDGCEVVLYTVLNGGHTWPGQKALLPTLGKSTLDISANNLMWEFFEKHPLGKTPAQN
jgi:polyhydroxybutyrate depolymerase